MEITCLQIRLLNRKEYPATAENDYVAEAIRDDDHWYYRAKGITLPITEHEFRMVTANPFAYYFSTALKLHLRLQRARATAAGEFT